MNKEFIPYQQALELKELGFDDKMRFDDIIKPWYHKGILCNNDMYLIPIINEHPRNCYAPLYQQAFRWFREKYGMLYTIEENLEDDQVWYEWDVKSSNGFEGSFEATYEEAELACLKKLIEIAKNK